MSSTSSNEPAAASTVLETPPRRGLHEDWTASIIGLAIFLIALFLSLGTRPENFGWETEKPTLSAEEIAAGKKLKSPWAAPLKGWIGKFSTWKEDPTAAFRPKPDKSKAAPKPEASKTDSAAGDASKSDASKSDASKSDA